MGARMGAQQHRRRGRSAQRGFLLATSLGVILFLTLAGSSLLTGGLSQTNISLRTQRRTSALYLAEAGLQQAMANLRTTDTIDDVMEDELATGAYVIESQEALAGSLFKVRAHGTSQGETRLVEGTFRGEFSSVFQYAVFGDEGVELSGNMETDSYDSRLGLYDDDPNSPTYNAGHNGDIGTNSTEDGALVLDGDSLIVDGQLVTGPDIEDPEALVQGYDETVITGGTDPPSDTQDVTSLPSSIPMTPITVPANLVCNDATINASSPLPKPLESGVHCYHNLTITGTDTFRSTGPVTIFLTGTLSVEGNAIVGTPSDPTDMIFYMASGGIATIDGSLEGRSTFYGGIYAPGATIAVGGNTEIFGAIAAEDVFVAGSALIHYDEAMADMENDPGYFAMELIAWREL